MTEGLRMDIWYTPERIALHHEIDQRRMARYARREKEAMRRSARHRVFETCEFAAGMLLALVGFYCCLLIAAI